MAATRTPVGRLHLLPRSRSIRSTPISFWKSNERYQRKSNERYQRTLAKQFWRREIQILNSLLLDSIRAHRETGRMFEMEPYLYTNSRSATSERPVFPVLSVLLSHETKLMPPTLILCCRRNLILLSFGIPVID